MLTIIWEIISVPRDGLDGSNELVVKALLIFGETPQGTTISEALDINDVVKINCVSNQSLFMLHVLCFFLILNQTFLFLFCHFKWVGLIPGGTELSIEQRLKNTLWQDSGLSLWRSHSYGRDGWKEPKMRLYIYFFFFQNLFLNV